MKRKISKFNFAVLAGLFVGSSSAVFAQTEGAIFRFSVRHSPHFETPAQAVTPDEKLLAQTLFEGLTSLSPDTLEVVGGVAESWRMSSDRKTYLFFIRPEARWSNGKKITANDFIAAWGKVLEHPENYPDAYLLTQNLSNTLAYLNKKLSDGVPEKSMKSLAVEAESIGDSTLKITLAQPREDFPYLLSLPIFYPIPPSSDSSISNGAFVLKEKNEQHLLLGKNSSYWGRRQVQVENLEVLISNDAYLVWQEYRSGKLNWTGTVDLAIIPATQLKGKSERLVPSARQYFYLQFINNLGSFASEVVRRAMSLTIKRELLQNYLVGASVKGGVGFYPRGSTTQDPLYLMAYQPRVAMQELQKNNFCVQPKAALNVPATNKDCKPLPVVEIQYPDFDVEKKLSLALCTIWHEELGIDCKTANQQSNIASDGNREVLHLHYIRPELPNLLSFLEQWSRYAGTPYNLLLRQLLAKPKTEQNLNWVRDLEKRLAQELPVIPLLESQSVSYVDPQVQGFYKNRLDIHPLKYVYFRTPTP